MKGARSGAQKLMKNKCSNKLDVGCICHLADLTVKASMENFLLIQISFFIDVFYYFYKSSKSFVTFGAPI